MKTVMLMVVVAIGATVGAITTCVVAHRKNNEFCSFLCWVDEKVAHCKAQIKERMEKLKKQAVEGDIVA